MVRYDDAEARFKAEIKKYIKDRGGFYSLIPEGTIGAIQGDPDIILGYKGYLIGCEAKAGTRQHGCQPDREEIINRAGCIYLLCDSIEQIATLLDRIDAVTDEYPRPPIIFGDLIPDRLRPVPEERKKKRKVRDWDTPDYVE